MPGYQWSIPGADGEAILGNTHVPAGKPQGVAIVAHGFKGNKDYGFFPRLTQHLTDAGLIAIRFNFSHSGMTNRIDTFERPDLFERDTWAKQVLDLLTIATGAARGDVPGTKDAGSLPCTWIGHSRGALTTLLAASRTFDGTAEPDAPSPTRVVALASPSKACSMDDATRQQLRTDGSLPSPSSRTGQLLRVGLAWLEEIEAAPQRYDPVAACRLIPVPVLFMHGTDDDAVPVSASRELADAAAHAELELLEHAGHTFNCPNPLPEKELVPEMTQAMFERVTQFALDA